MSSFEPSKNDMQDIKYVEEAEESVSTETDADRAAEEKRLVRKIDIALLPCIWVMYLLSYMDVRRPSQDSYTLGHTADCRSREPTLETQRWLA